MKKHELLKPGQYAGTPLAVLARKDLTATAKNVYTALGAHLGRNAEWVYPSVARLSKMTAASRSAVKTAIHALADAGLVEIDRRPGKSARYRFKDPTGSESDLPVEPRGESTGSESDLPEGQATGSDSDPHPVRIRPTPGQNLTPNHLKNHSKNHSPPTPPQAGGAKRGDFSKAEKLKLTERIDDAHVEAFGKPLPNKWRRDIGREYRNGDRAALAKIDAETLREAEKYRVKNNWACLGHGTVMQYLAHLDRKAKAKRQADARAKAATDKANAEAEANTEARRQQAEAMEFFRSLPVDERERFIGRVRDRPFAPLVRPDILNQMAANLALSERESLAVTGRD